MEPDRRLATADRSPPRRRGGPSSNWQPSNGLQGRRPRSLAHAIARSLCICRVTPGSNPALSRRPFRSARPDPWRRGPSYDCGAVTSHKRGVLSVVAGVIALVCAIASATLAIYCAMLVYAATTFEHDSLPGPVVLSMVAVGVGLAAAFCGGLSHVLWRVSKRQIASARPPADPGRER